jgi:hypothetical protein
VRPLLPSKTASKEGRIPKGTLSLSAEEQAWKSHKGSDKEFNVILRGGSDQAVFGTLHLHYEKHIPQKFGYRVVIQYGYSPLRSLRENFEIYK